jgi:hypothetical protein
VVFKTKRTPRPDEEQKNSFSRQTDPLGPAVIFTPLYARFSLKLSPFNPMGCEPNLLLS